MGKCVPETQNVNEIFLSLQNSCAMCGGSGMVMDLSGPSDCPNFDTHVMIARLQRALIETNFTGKNSAEKGNND